MIFGVRLPAVLRVDRMPGRRFTLRLAMLLALGLPLLIGVVTVAARPGLHRLAEPARAVSVCRVPRLSGLLVAAARERAARAGCATRLLGARLQRPEIQTIDRQSPRPGRQSRLVSAWVNPLCSGSAAAGPPSGEPFLKRGPTALRSGLYLDGGPHRFRSAPRCASISGTPGAGTVTVTNPLSGAVLATKTVTAGHIATIPLPAGTYMILGTFANATRNGQDIRSLPKRVTIPAGETVRQDVSASVP